MSTKQAVLILGGCGCVGRQLVLHLLECDECSIIRVVDKQVPKMAFMSAAHAAAFESALVEFKQGDLSRDVGVARAFEGRCFDIVFNLTYDGIPFGQADEVYEQRVLDVSTKLGAAAVQHRVRRFIELSTAQVYESKEKPSKEDSKLKPWTKQASFKLRAEEALRAMGELPLTIIRPACIYGPGDTQGLSPRVLCAAVYAHNDEKMRFLWDGSLALNTVHVRDVCRAMWHVALLPTSPPVLNLADHGKSTQATISAVLEKLFAIKTAFVGTLASRTITAVGLRSFAEAANEKHMEPWAKMCQKADIANTPLTPYIDAELLAHNHLALDGSLVTSTGFRYSVPTLTPESLREQIDLFIEQKLFPPVLSG